MRFSAHFIVIEVQNHTECTCQNRWDQIFQWKFKSNTCMISYLLENTIVHPLFAILMNKNV